MWGSGVTDVQNDDDNIKFNLFSATSNQSQADLKYHNKNGGKRNRELIKHTELELSQDGQSLDTPV